MSRVIEREAVCSCGQLRLIAEGEPVRVSVCHCLACQRRTGSAVGFQAVAVPVGAFADSAFQPPEFSVWESRKHSWVTVPSGVEHDDV